MLDECYFGLTLKSIEQGIQIQNPSLFKGSIFAELNKNSPDFHMSKFLPPKSNNLNVFRG